LNYIRFYANTLLLWLHVWVRYIFRMGMALEFNLKRFVWRMIPSQQMSRIILNIYIYNISYITYLYKLPPTPHQDSFLHVQCCKAQVASLATDLRGQLGQLQFPKAYPRYFTASMLASESSWWRPSRLYRRPRSHSRIRDSTVSDSTVLPGPSYLGPAMVHKHALSHACLCTLARPKFYPISWRAAGFKLLQCILQTKSLSLWGVKQNIAGQNETLSNSRQ
jgi:hypothetical protein